MKKRIILFLILLIVSGFILFLYLAEKGSYEYDNEGTIRIFIETSVPEKDILTLQNELKAYSEVISVEYITREQAIALLEKNNQREGVVVRLKAVVKRRPENQGIEDYPQRVLDFLDSKKIDSPTPSIISSMSFEGLPLLSNYY